MLDFFRCTQKAAPYLKDTRRHKNEPFLEKGNIISFVRSFVRSFDYRGEIHFVKPFLPMFTIILPVSQSPVNRRNGKVEQLSKVLYKVKIW